MGERQVPTKDQALEAVHLLLTAIETDGDVLDAIDRIGALHPKYNTFPGEILMRLAADGLDEGGVDRHAPIPQERLVERYLPECEFRGKNNSKIRYAILAAAATNGGVEVDLLDEVTYWGGDDFWRYAAFAALAWIRAVADQRSIALSELCPRLRVKAEVQLADF